MTAIPSTPPSAGRPSSSLHFVVGEMSGKLDQIMGTILPQLADLRAADVELSSRMTTLETLVNRWQYGFLGFISIGGVLWAILEKAPTILTLVKVLPQ